MADLIGELLGIASSVATWYTRRRFGIVVKLNDKEQKAIGMPLARLVQRRFDLRRDFNDAKDAAGAAGGITSYVERVLSEAKSPDPARTVFAGPTSSPREPDRPASPPAPTSTLQSDERVAAPAPAARAPVFTSPRGREIGAGPLKDALAITYDG